MNMDREMSLGFCSVFWEIHLDDIYLNVLFLPRE